MVMGLERARDEKVHPRSVCGRMSGWGCFRNDVAINNDVPWKVCVLIKIKSSRWASSIHRPLSVPANSDHQQKHQCMRMTTRTKRDKGWMDRWVGEAEPLIDWMPFVIRFGIDDHPRTFCLVGVLFISCKLKTISIGWTWTDPIHLIRWEIDNMRITGKWVRTVLNTICRFCCFWSGKAFFLWSFYFKKNSPSLK